MTAPVCPGQCCSACCTCAAPLRLVAAELVRGGWAGEALGLYRQILAQHPATATMELMDLGSIAAELARCGLVPATPPPRLRDMLRQRPPRPPPGHPARQPRRPPPAPGRIAGAAMSLDDSHARPTYRPPPAMERRHRHRLEVSSHVRSPRHDRPGTGARLRRLPLQELRLSQRLGVAASGRPGRGPGQRRTSGPGRTRGPGSRTRGRQLSSRSRRSARSGNRPPRCRPAQQGDRSRPASAAGLRGAAIRRTAPLMRSQLRLPLAGLQHRGLPGTRNRAGAPAPTTN